MKYEDLIVNYRENKIEFDDIMKEMDKFFHKTKSLVKFHSIEEDQRYSLYMESVLRAVRSFKLDGDVKFSSYLLIIYLNSLRAEYKRMNNLGNKAHSDSVEFENTNLNKYDYINEFNINEELYKNLKIALNWVDDKQKPYVIDLLLGNIQQSKVAEILGVTKQYINNSLRKFKKDVKMLMEV